MTERVHVRRRRRAKDPPVVEPESQVTTPAPAERLGSWGDASIDKHDHVFIAARDAVARKTGVRVDAHFMKAVMDVETDDRQGDMPLDACRPCDGEDCVPACGPFQIKWPYHQARCPECSKKTLAGHAELAFHVIADTMKSKGLDEYGAFLAAYFTADDVNGTTQREYVAHIKRRVATMEADLKGAVEPDVKPVPEPKPALDPWRPYPYPKMVDLIVPKPREGAGFTRCPFRLPLMQALGTHITDGPHTQTLEYLRDFFGTGGARQWDALTDLGIEYSGRIGLFNDWRDPDRGGTRAGWANGWGPEGSGFENGGAEFYRRFPDINVVILSIEHFQKAGGKWSDAMIDSTIEVRTAFAQSIRVPASSYPINPRTGLSIEQQHRNFARKSCPAEPYITTYEPIIIGEVKKKLAAWQGGDVAIPDPIPVKTYTDWGLSLEQVRHEFGILSRHNEDGTVDELPFDPSGAISLAWLNRCERDGVFPEAEELRTWDSNIRPGKELWASFEGGWRLIRAAGDNRDSWRWLDEVA